MRADLLALPLGGLALVLLGLGFGAIIARAMGFSVKTGATFIISASLANHGFTMGGFICYLILDERGLGYSFIFISYFMLFIYLVIFPYARRIARREGNAVSLPSNFFDLQNMPLFAVILALILGTSGISRPNIAFPVDILLVLSVASYYFSLGLNFRVSDIGKTLRATAVLSAEKFVLVPAAAILILRFVQLPRDITQVIAVQSFMPAAIFSVLASILYGLDTTLASGTFVATTILFVTLVLPPLLMFLPGLL